MDKKELYAWMAENTQIYEDGEYDERSNYLSYTIYEKNGEHYMIQFCNGHPSEKWVNGKGYVRGVYEPTKVTRKTETIERVYWV